MKPYNSVDESLSSVTLSGSPDWAISWYVCHPGTRLIFGMCLEAASLTLHSAKIDLSISGVKIGYSCTLQGWYQIMRTGAVTKAITILEVINLVKVDYQSGSLRLTTYNLESANAQATTSLSTSLNTRTWYHIALVHF